MHDDYLPDWIGDFAVAEKLGIPYREVRHQPLRDIYRARTMIAAEHEAQRLRQTGT